MLFSRIPLICISSHIKQLKSVNYLAIKHFRSNHHHFIKPKLLNQSWILPSLVTTAVGHTRRSMKTDIKSTEWNLVYRFPYIVHARIFSRFKFYFTLISVINFPIAISLFSFGHIGLSECMMTFGVTTFSLLLLYGFGQLFRRLIGTIYTSPDDRWIRFSHLTFFGNRAETVTELDDIMQLNDCNQNMNDFLLQIKLNDLESETFSKTLFICLKLGGIVDQKRFRHIFGNI